MEFMDKVKDFADKAGDSVMKGMKSASDGVKKFQEKTTLKKGISELEAGLKDAFVEIGKRFYEANPESEEYAELYQIINDNNAKIGSLKDQLAALDDKAACPSCGASIAKDAKFCDKCGAKIENPAEAEVQPTKFCSKCGEPIAEESNFCDKCGASTEQTTEEKTEGSESL